MQYLKWECFPYFHRFFIVLAERAVSIEKVNDWTNINRLRKPTSFWYSKYKKNLKLIFSHIRLSIRPFQKANKLSTGREKRGNWLAVHDCSIYLKKCISIVFGAPHIEAQVLQIQLLAHMIVLFFFLFFFLLHTTIHHFIIYSALWCYPQVIMMPVLKGFDVKWFLIEVILKIIFCKFESIITYRPNERARFSQSSKKMLHFHSINFIFFQSFTNITLAIENIHWSLFNFYWKGFIECGEKTRFE